MQFAVVIPYYNKYDEIYKCLDSIEYAASRFSGTSPIEVVISDDGSKVPLEDDIDVHKYSRLEIKVYTHSNVGCAQARLLGIQQLKSPDDTYVVHVDPDDTLLPDAFEQIHDWISTHEEVDVYLGNLMMFDVGVEIPYFYTAQGYPNPKVLGKVYEAKIEDIMKRGHPVVYKFAKLGLWRKCLQMSQLRVNCNEDLFLSALLYSHCKTAMYTDICHYNYAFGQPTSIMTNVADEPRDSKLTYMLAGLINFVRCNGSRRGNV